MLHSLCTPIDRTCEPARLTREVELEVEVEQVFKRLASNLADRALADARERCVQ